jgi:hypothetical protein
MFDVTGIRRYPVLRTATRRAPLHGSTGSATGAIASPRMRATTYLCCLSPHASPHVREDAVFSTRRWNLEEDQTSKGSFS